MKDKEKILYIITKSNFGGAQRYVYDLATNLPNGKFEAVVVLGGNGLLKEKLAQRGIRVISVPKLGRDIKFFDEFYVFYYLLRLFRKENPDIIHLNSSKIGGLGAFAGRVYNLLNSLSAKTRGRKTKIIFTAHGWAFKEERPFGQKVIITLASWLTVMLSHRVITVSENDFSMSPWIAVRKDKTACVHNGIKPRIPLEKDEAKGIIFSRNGAVLREYDSCVIGTIAELHKNKGLGYLVESFSEIAKSKAGKNCFLALIGDGEEHKALQARVKKLKLTKKVIFLGFIAEAGNFLKSFDVFVLPSLKEGLPYTILEAGAAGLPVVATSVGGIPEIIEDMKTGILVRPREPKELASAIKFLIENKEKAAELGKNLSEKVASEFTLEKMVRETMEVYG